MNVQLMENRASRGSIALHAAPGDCWLWDTNVSRSHSLAYASGYGLPGNQRSGAGFAELAFVAFLIEGFDQQAHLFGQLLLGFEQ